MTQVRSESAPPSGVVKEPLLRLQEALRKYVLQVIAQVDEDDPVSVQLADELLVGLSLAGSYFVLNRRVLKRLAVFSTLADRLRQGDKSDLRWPDAGVDEFDNLAASLNDLLLTAKNQQTELAHLANHDPLPD